MSFDLGVWDLTEKSRAASPAKIAIGRDERGTRREGGVAVYNHMRSDLRLRKCE